VSRLRKTGAIGLNLCHRYSWCGRGITLPLHFFYQILLKWSKQELYNEWQWSKTRWKLEKYLENKILHRVQTRSGAYLAYAQSVSGALCPTVRRPVCEAGHSPSCSAENESARNSPSTGTPSWRKKRQFCLTCHSVIFQVLGRRRNRHLKHRENDVLAIPQYLRGGDEWRNGALISDREKLKKLTGKLTPLTNRPPQILHKIAQSLNRGLVRNQYRTILKLSIPCKIYVKVPRLWHQINAKFSINTILTKHHQQVSVQVCLLQGENNASL